MSRVEQTTSPGCRYYLVRIMFHVFVAEDLQWRRTSTDINSESSSLSACQMKRFVTLSYTTLYTFTKLVPAILEGIHATVFTFLKYKTRLSHINPSEMMAKRSATAYQSSPNRAYFRDINGLSLVYVFECHLRIGYSTDNMSPLII